MSFRTVLARDSGPRMLAAFLVLLFCACSPSSRVTQTTPVGNLQSYHTVMLRITPLPSIAQHINSLEFATYQSLVNRCNFAIVTPGQPGPPQTPDLVIDLIVRRAVREGSSWIENQRQATVDVTMVLSDGIDQSLLGSAEIQGKSAAMSSGRDIPETVAFKEIGKQVGSVLATSGCAGPRLARVQPIPEKMPTESATGGAITPEQVAQAEAYNDEGKRLFRSAKIAEAKQQFLAALSIARDPRYYFNLCLAHEALSEFDHALQTCKYVLAAKPDERLAGKATQRLKIIEDKRG